MAVIGSNTIIHKRIESTEKFVPLTPSATSYGMGWKTLQAVHYREGPVSGESSLPPVSRHKLFLIIRPSERLELRSEGVRLNRPPAHRRPSIQRPRITSPSEVQARSRHRAVAVIVRLESSSNASAATRAIRLGSRSMSRASLLPSRHHRTELPAGITWIEPAAGSSLLAESFANILAVHLIRHITGARRLKAAADGVLPRHKVL